MVKVWGLIAIGELAIFSTEYRHFCRKVFWTKEDAIAYIPEFRKNVTEIRSDSLTDLADNDNLRISPVELELDGVEPGFKFDQVGDEGGKMGGEMKKISLDEMDKVQKEGLAGIERYKQMTESK